MVLLVRKHYDERWHRLNVEMLDDVLTLVTVDPVEKDRARSEVLAHPLDDHLL